MSVKLFRKHQFLTVLSYHYGLDLILIVFVLYIYKEKYCNPDICMFLRQVVHAV